MRVTIHDTPIAFLVIRKLARPRHPLHQWGLQHNPLLETDGYPRVARQVRPTAQFHEHS
jgi:hypothetical protein